MSEKFKVVRIQRPDTHGQMSCVMPLKGFQLEDEFDGAEVGESVTATYEEMTPEEFEALGEFTGW